MGLLDDAIREHLDLKRRRGADPSEVARLEHEALGPVRREPAAAAPAEAAHEAHEPDEAHEHPVPAGEPHAAGTTHAVPLEEAHEGPHGDPLRAPAEPEPHHEPEPEPHPEPVAEDPRHSDLVLQETTEFRVEDHHDEHEDAPADDVLEETPEFLQETPEHDRLWFEQRPPRDFDFDG